MDATVTEGNSAIEMPKYKCYKEVWALKIDGIEPTVDGGAWLTFENTKYGKRKVDRDYIQKRGANAGGYFVLYADGYQSFSPAEAFEDGYTLIEDEPKK